MQSEHGERDFSAEGAVVEILERGGQRFAKIVIEPGTVLELPAGAIDLSLGDRVTVDASLHITRVRGGNPGAHNPGALGAPGALGPGAPGASQDPGAPGALGASSRLRLQDYQHVLRMAGVFVLALAVFLVWRAWMVPSDFGVYGHFRAGAITDAAAETPHFAGEGSCLSCHDAVQQVRLVGSHANVRCEACHGPLGRHARGEADTAPIRPSSRAVCLTCHTSGLGAPASFPQVIVNEHSEAGPCTDCHTAHAPGIS
jgi:hypothetical protein